ncbi:hypothetical protein V6N13_020120 [Hibiscus sabdariffa]|uniref:Uncharacterized protein n=1 Tax=Hibiscus sabdariffa TaxID=183260 RepID=A0ABR2ESK0_9ROSI
MEHFGVHSLHPWCTSRVYSGHPMMLSLLPFSAFSLHQQCLSVALLTNHFYKMSKDAFTNTSKVAPNLASTSRCLHDQGCVQRSPLSMKNGMPLPILLFGSTSEGHSALVFRSFLQGY